MSEGQLPKDIRIEIEAKIPNDDDHSVIVFQETEVPQRPPKPPLPICTAWKVFSELSSESKPAVFKFPLLTDLEAEILLPDSTTVRVSGQDIQKGSKWLLVEAEKKTEGEGEGESGNSTSNFVFREGNFSFITLLKFRKTRCKCHHVPSCTRFNLYLTLMFSYSRD